MDTSKPVRFWQGNGCAGFDSHANENFRIEMKNFYNLFRPEAYIVIGGLFGGLLGLLLSSVIVLYI